MLKLVFGIWAIFFTGCAIGFTIKDFYAWEAEWQELACGPKGEELALDDWDCDDIAPIEVVDASEDCELEAYPESEESIDYVRAACADKSIFKRYDECIERYTKDENFVKKVAELNDTLECYAKWLKKHDLKTKLWKL